MSSSTRIDPAVRAIAGHLGAVVHEERARRRWTLRQLAARSGVSAGMLHHVEAGGVGSIATYVAIARALALRPSFDIVDPRRRTSLAPSVDPVHAAMGDLIARRLARPGVTVALDEPYQHYQFAGRADVLAWSLEPSALLHVENRTRFPDLQDAFGSYNAKRRFLAASVAERLGLRGGFDVVSHAIVGLWSSEVLHTVRIRSASFAAVCPDPPTDLDAWLSGTTPIAGRPTSTFVALDPLASARQRAIIDLTQALKARPRYRGYADALDALVAAGRA